jgi:hypothetical protein
MLEDDKYLTSTEVGIMFKISAKKFNLILVDAKILEVRTRPSIVDPKITRKYYHIVYGMTNFGYNKVSKNSASTNPRWYPWKAMEMLNWLEKQGLLKGL